MTAPLEPHIALNYQLLVDSGDRTWTDVAAMADKENSPVLAAYARERASATRPAPAAPTEAPARQRPESEKTTSPPDNGR